jgi:Mn-dependent DtxR family transcriptional regulator
MVVTARYNRLSQLYWPRARDWDEKTRNLGAYLHTCRHSTGEGYYALPVAYMADDMNWTVAIATKALKTLEDAGEVRFDPKAAVVLVPEALEVQAPTTEKQIKGAVARIRMVPLSYLLAEFYRLAVTHSNGLAEAIAKDLHDQVEEAMRMETVSHSNGNHEAIRVGGLRV